MPRKKEVDPLAGLPPKRNKNFWESLNAKQKERFVVYAESYEKRLKAGIEPPVEGVLEVMKEEFGFAPTHNTFKRLLKRKPWTP